MNVLVVDDSRFARTLVKGYLGELRPDWRIHDAPGIEEAVTVAQGLALDAAILDLNMPGGDGITLADRLRERQPGLRVVLLTANIQESVRQRAEAHAMFFAAKPITPERIAQIAVLLEGPGHGA